MTSRALVLPSEKLITLAIPQYVVPAQTMPRALSVEREWSR